MWLFIQELLTRHKILSAEFLEIHYDKVFSHYQRLLNSENYVTRRQSLKLLGELLLDRHNFTVSIKEIFKYIFNNKFNNFCIYNQLKYNQNNIFAFIDIDNRFMFKRYIPTFLVIHIHKINNGDWNILQITVIIYINKHSLK